MAELTIRMGQAEDFELLGRFYDEVVEANHGTPYDVYWDRSVHPSDKEILDAIEGGSMYMGMMDGELVAASIVNDFFATGYEKTPWVYAADSGKVLCIHLFSTRPSVQGKGLGRRFLQAIVDDTRARGIELLRLDAFQHNTPACSLYESMGFEYRGIGDLTYEEEDFPSDLPIVMYELKL